MVNLQSAENALKSFYLDAVKEAIDSKTSPFLAMIEHSTSNVYGKDVKKIIRSHIGSGVMAGTETGELPKADESGYIQLTATLKNLYGKIEISDKALRASQSNEGAFVNLLNDEMQHLLESAKFNFNRMLMGDGTGFLTEVISVENGKLYVQDVSVVQEGMRVCIVDQDYESVDDGKERMVTAVSYEDNTLALSGNAIDSTLKNVYLVLANQGEELTGLKALFENSNIYGLTDEEYQRIKPIQLDMDDAYDEYSLLNVIDRIEQRSNSAPNLIICSYGVRRELIEYYKAKGIAMPSTELEGGFKALTINGIPVVADRFCGKGCMYIINTNDFKLYQLCDWQWMESDDGKVLHQVPGKPVYTATLVKYAELLCERPAAQARIINIKES